VTSPSTTPPRVVVTAAVVRRGDLFLVTRRLRGVHLEGCWEFPGGKCEPAETLPECLAREVLEELGTEVRIETELLAVTHAYPERLVELHFFACTLADEPQAILGQEMRWVHRSELASLDLPPADSELIALLQRLA
jgi:8-oxo-dGTP diphosphatase